MGQLQKEIFAQILTQQQCALLAAGGTQVEALAGKGDEKIVGAVRTTHPRDSLLSVAADAKRLSRPLDQEQAVLAGLYSEKKAALAGRPNRFLARFDHAVYVLAAVEPPRPVQLVWKNWPRGRSTRS
jgi:hypothetical protein